MVVFGKTQLLLSGQDHIQGSRVEGERHGEEKRENQREITGVAKG